MKRALLSLMAFGALTGIVASTATASDWGYSASPSHHASHDVWRHEAAHERATHRAYDYGYSNDHGYGYSTRGYGHSSYGYGHSSPSYGYGGHPYSRPPYSHWSFGFGW